MRAAIFVPSRSSGKDRFVSPWRRLGGIETRVHSRFHPGSNSGSGSPAQEVPDVSLALRPAMLSESAVGPLAATGAVSRQVA